MLERVVIFSLLLCGLNGFGAISNLYLFVPNFIGGSSVSKIDPVTNTVVGQIPVGLEPLVCAFTPDGTKGYATAYGSANVTIFDTASGAVLQTVNVGTMPEYIAITADGKKAVVCNAGVQSVSILDITNNNAVRTVATSNIHPNYVAFSSDSTTAFVANIGDNTNPSTVDVIDLNSMSGMPIANVGVGVSPQSLAIAPNGNIYVPAFNAPGGAPPPFNVPNVTVFSSSSPYSVITTITANVGQGAESIVISPDGTKAAFVNEVSNSITVINTSTNTAQFVAGYVGMGPFFLGITPDSSMAFVTNGTTHSVSSIDLTTNSWINSISLPNGPAGLAISPDGKYVYVAIPPANELVVIDNTMSLPVFDTTIPGTAMFPFSFPYYPAFNFSTSQALSPPTNLTGASQKNTFLLQIDLINVLTWNAPTSGTVPASYNIYLDEALTNLIGTVPSSGPLEFLVHNRRKNTSYTYYVVSVSQSGALSSPVSITINP